MKLAIPRDRQPHRSSPMMDVEDEEEKESVSAVLPIAPLPSSRLHPEDARDLDESLKRFLAESGLLETRQDVIRRGRAVACIQEQLWNWVQMKTDRNSRANLRFHPFGSGALGSNLIGGDVDMLVVLSAALSSSEFLDEIPGFLKRELGDRLQYVRSVAGASIPLVSVQIDNLEMDLIPVVYKQIWVPELHTLNWLDRQLYEKFKLEDMNVASLCKRLGGVQDLHQMRQLLPAKQAHAFQWASRAIKHWAKSRGIYSNKHGYMGGVSWAIMLLRVLMDHPEVIYASQALQCFFHRYHPFDWNQKEVHLLSEDPNAVKGRPRWFNGNVDAMRVWTPKREHASNSCYNVTLDTRVRIQSELARSHRLWSRTVAAAPPFDWALWCDRWEWYAECERYMVVRLDYLPEEEIQTNGAPDVALEFRWKPIVELIDARLGVIFRNFRVVPISKWVGDRKGMCKMLLLGVVALHHGGHSTLSDAAKNLLDACVATYKKDDGPIALPLKTSVGWWAVGQLPDVILGNPHAGIAPMEPGQSLWTPPCVEVDGIPREQFWSAYRSYVQIEVRYIDPGPAVRFRWHGWMLRILDWFRAHLRASRSVRSEVLSQSYHVCETDSQRDCVVVIASYYLGIREKDQAVVEREMANCLKVPLQNRSSNSIAMEWKCVIEPAVSVTGKRPSAMISDLEEGAAGDGARKRAARDTV